MKHIVLPAILLLLLVIVFTACVNDNTSAEALKKYNAQTEQVKSDVDALKSKLQYENQLGAINAQLTK